jgi:hypothetical protein
LPFFRRERAYGGFNFLNRAHAGTLPHCSIPHKPRLHGVSRQTTDNGQLTQQRNGHCPA